MARTQTEKLDDFMRWIMRGAIAALLAVTAYFLMRVVERQDTIAHTLTRVAEQQAVMSTQVQRLQKDVNENRDYIMNRGN